MQPTGSRRSLRACSLASLLVLASCAPPSRFALRDPVAAEPPRAWLDRPPASRPTLRVTDAVDQLVLTPAVSALAFRARREATDVNALDEVPDSSWFTNRRPTALETAAGACRDVAPAREPFEVTRAKIEGTTPGLFVRDATGREFLIKFDSHPDDRPETATAADAIVSRLYWAIGYNTPCNRVAWIAPSAFALRTDATDPSPTMAALREFLASAVRDDSGRVRVSTSLLVEGTSLGPWPGTGVRSDDPNDIVPHEDRRELRAERFLAAWVNHWDAREINTLDSFVRDPENPARGTVRHWMLDFSDALGGRTSQRDRARRLGYAGMFGVHVGREPWRSLRIDPGAPNLGYFEFEHFDPDAWVPILPVERFDRADTADEAWMARRVALLSRAHVVAAVSAGEFTSERTQARLVEVLVARRAALLRAAFARRSSLADVTLDHDLRICARDLALELDSAVGPAPRYAVTVFAGGRQLAPRESPVVSQRGANVCATLPPHFAPDDAPDESPERYAIVAIERRARTRTLLRAHLYDLGPQRGFVLVGLER